MCIYTHTRMFHGPKIGKYTVHGAYGMYDTTTYVKHPLTYVDVVMNGQLSNFRKSSDLL